jgi:hypothetical protein
MTPSSAAAAASPGVRRARTAAPPRPRRVSGPVRRPAQPVRKPVQTDGGLVLGVLALGKGLSNHTALDRLIRGRIWIGLIAFALIGIVTLQLLVLQLNAGIGRALVREAQLQRENAAESVESSELASGERVEAQAGRLGMQLVPIGALRFLGSDPRADVARAAAALGTPVHGSSAGSGEAGGVSQGSAAGAVSASTATTTGASGEQASAEASGPAAGAATTPSASGEASSATAEQNAAASAPTGSPSATSPAPSSTPGASTAATAATGESAPVGSAGGVGAAAANGAG